MNPSNFYRRSDLSARSFYNSKESLSSEDISIPGSEYLPSEDENDHLSLYTSSDISSSETSSDESSNTHLLRERLNLLQGKHSRYGIQILMVDNQCHFQDLQLVYLSELPLKIQQIFPLHCFGNFLMMKSLV